MAPSIGSVSPVGSRTTQVRGPSARDAILVASIELPAALGASGAIEGRRSSGSVMKPASGARGTRSCRSLAGQRRPARALRSFRIGSRAAGQSSRKSGTPPHDAP